MLVKGVPWKQHNLAASYQTRAKCYGVLWDRLRCQRHIRLGGYYVIQGQSCAADSFEDTIKRLIDRPVLLGIDGEIWIVRLDVINEDPEPLWSVVSPMQSIHTEGISEQQLNIKMDAMSQAMIHYKMAMKCVHAICIS